MTLPPLDALGASLLACLLTYAIHSTLLLGLAWVVTARLRRAAWREAIWKTALVAGLLTASLPWNLGWRLPLGDPEVLAVVPLPLAVERAAELVGRLPGATAVEGALFGSQADSIYICPLRAALAGVTGSWGMTLLAAWMLLALMRVGGMALRHVAFLHRLQRSPSVSGEHQRMLDQLARAARLTWRPRLTLSAHLPTPIALGRREICLPLGRFDRLTPEQRESILAHELAHLVRRDPQWLLATELLCAVLCFQPLHRVAQRRWRQAAELLCDDAAVAATGKRLPLVQGLTELAATLRGGPSPVLAMAEPGSLLVRRVQRVLEGGRLPEPALGQAARAVLIVGVVAATGLAPAFVGPLEALTATPRQLFATAGATLLRGGTATPEKGWEAKIRLVGDHDGAPYRFELTARGVVLEEGGEQVRAILPGGHLELFERQGGFIRWLRLDNDRRGLVATYSDNSGAPGAPETTLERPLDWLSRILREQQATR